MVHATTTTKNPLKIKQMHDIVFDYIRYNPFLMATSRDVEPHFRPVGDLRVWKTLMYITQELPLQLNYLYQKARSDERKI